jgi:hypothetical protein
MLTFSINTGKLGCDSTSVTNPGPTDVEAFPWNGRVMLKAAEQIARIVSPAKK